MTLPGLGKSPGKNVHNTLRSGERIAPIHVWRAGVSVTKLTVPWAMGPSFPSAALFMARHQSRGTGRRVQIYSNSDRFTFARPVSNPGMRFQVTLAFTGLATASLFAQTTSRTAVVAAFTPREAAPAFVVECYNNSASAVPFPTIRNIR